MLIDILKFRKTSVSVSIIPLGVAAFLTALLLFLAGRDGYYGDELYYIACGKHLAFGYVDHPPLTPVLTLIAGFLFGANLFGLRIMAALFGAGIVLLSAGITRELGGRKFAQGLAALLILVSTAFPGICSFFSTNVVDIFFCSLALYLILRLMNGASPVVWLFLGLVMGFGLLNKYTMLVLGLAFFMALLLTKERFWLKTRWPYLCGLIAFLLFFPHLIWQYANHWPTLEFMRKAVRLKNISLSPLGLLLQIIASLNPLTLPVWLSGFFYLFVKRENRRYQILGLTVLFFLAVYFTHNSKFYYVVPVMPLLLASGSVLTEHLLSHARGKWLKPLFISLLVISGGIMMPLAIPLLPVNQYLAYQSKIQGFWDLVRTERGANGALPGHFIARLGWEELVQTVGQVYQSLPDNEKPRCAILTGWYTSAAAIDRFGPGYGLPKAICGRNNYWLWGYGDYTGEILITVGFGAREMEGLYNEVEEAVLFERPYLYSQAICICRKPKFPLKKIWPWLKGFY